MRILALEVEKPGATADDFQPLLSEEAKAVWMEAAGKAKTESNAKAGKDSAKETE